MKPDTLASAAARIAMAFMAGLAIALHGLEAWLWCVAQLARVLLDAASWWLQDTAALLRASRFELSGMIELRMTLDSGATLPRFPGEWGKHVQQAKAVFVVAVAVWPAAPMRWSRRLPLLAFALAAAACVAAVDLVAEAKLTALRHIGYELLPSLSFADTEANVRAFAALAREFRALEWIKAFLDAGGRLFLAGFVVLAGALAISDRWPR